NSGTSSSSSSGRSAAGATAASSTARPKTTTTSTGAGRSISSRTTSARRTTSLPTGGPRRTTRSIRSPAARWRPPTSGIRRASSSTVRTSSTGSTARSSSSTSSGVLIGRPESRRASSRNGRCTAWHTAATSAFRATTPAPCPSATFASASYPDARSHATLGNDVPPVLHLGGLVRDDGHLPRPDAAFHRPADRPGVRRDGDRRTRLALLHRHHCRPILLEREAARAVVPRQRRVDVGRVDADVVLRLLPAAHTVRALLHADVVAHQLGVVSPPVRFDARLSGDSRARHHRLDRRRYPHR